ncbi:hypothetical protein ACS0TY_020752 [Phlomoides rotata]
MREIEGLDGGAHEYLREIDASKYTFSHDGSHHYGIMATNISESIIGVLKGARRLPITAIVSTTFTRSKNAFLEREEEAINLQQKNQRWSDHVLHIFDKDQKIGDEAYCRPLQSFQTNNIGGFISGTLYNLPSR